jgi:hypothetical protein
MGRKECLSRILHETAIAVHREGYQMLRSSANPIQLKMLGG